MSMNSDSSGSGKTATVMVLVCTRPRFSVGGTRCHRWPPASLANVSSAPGPDTTNATNPSVCSVISTSKTPPLHQFHVDGELIFDEELCVSATFGSTNFYDWHGCFPLQNLVESEILEISLFRVRAGCCATLATTPNSNGSRFQLPGILRGFHGRSGVRCPY